MEDAIGAKERSILFVKWNEESMTNLEFGSGDFISGQEAKSREMYRCAEILVFVHAVSPLCVDQTCLVAPRPIITPGGIFSER